MKNLVMAFVVLTLIGCEAIQEINRPDNTASTVVDSVREQKEQTEEITDSTEAIAGTLESIDREAESILNDIALFQRTETTTSTRPSTASRVPQKPSKSGWTRRRKNRFESKRL